MSNVIDNEVVRMQFDNAQFESNVKTSMSTIEKLKASLNFNAAKDSFKQIDKAASTVDFSKMEKSLDSLERKFSVIGIAWAKVIMDMTAKVEHFAKSVTANLTVVPIKAGLQEYENQIDSVQTIMANTGRNVKDVNAALDELNEYADLTIYNFGQMTSNVGKFTAAIGKTPGGLEKSTQAIKGIGNWAAFAGANATQMATATYQLSQALGAGAIKLQDWRSVENASMAGMNFQEAFKETAREMGIAVDAAIAKEGTFRNSLKEGWLTTEVFFKTMDKFANDPAMTDAATKVKTFTQLIDVLKEALGTGWATTWRSVIGDFEEAKAFFTSVSDLLTGVINNANDSRNKVIGEWASGLKDIAEYSNGYQTGMTEFWGGDSGRKDLIKSIENLTNAFATLIGPAGEAWDVVFGPLTSDSLKSLSQKVEDFTHSLILNMEAQTDIKRAFVGIFSVLKTFIGIVGSILKLAGSILSTLSPLILILLRIAAVLGTLLKAVIDTANKINLVGKIFEGIQIIVSLLVVALAKLFELIRENAAVQAIVGKISDSFERFLSVLNSIRLAAINKFIALLTTAKELINDIFNSPAKKKSGGGLQNEIRDIDRSSAIGNSALMRLTREHNKELEQVYKENKKSYDNHLKKQKSAYNESKKIISSSEKNLEASNKKHVSLLKQCSTNMSSTAEAISKVSATSANAVKDSVSSVSNAVSSIDTGELVNKLKTALSVGVVIAGVSAICTGLVRLSASFAMLGKTAEMSGEAIEASLNAKALSSFVRFFITFGLIAAGVVAAFVAVSKVLESNAIDVSEYVSSAGSALEKGINTISLTSSKIKAKLSELYANSNLADKSLEENLKRFIGMGVFVATVTAATIALYNIGKAFGGFGEGLEAVGKGVRNYLTGKGLDEASDALYALGVAMLSIAASMWIISTINPDSFTRAAITIGVIAAALGVLLFWLNTFNSRASAAAKAAEVASGKGNAFTRIFESLKAGLTGFVDVVKNAFVLTAQIAAVSIALLSFVGSLWLFVKVIDAYSDLDVYDISESIVKMAAPFLILTTAVLALGLAAKNANFLGMGIAITAFVGSMYLMLNVINKFIDLSKEYESDWGTLEGGLLMVAKSMGVLALAVAAIGLATKKSAGSILASTVLIWTLIGALYAFAGVTKLLKDAGEGLASAAGALTMLTVAVAGITAALSLLNKAGNFKRFSDGVLVTQRTAQSLAAKLIAAGALVMSLTGALFIFAKAAQEFAKVKLGAVVKTFVSLHAILVMMGTFAFLVSKLNWKPMLAFAAMFPAFVASLYLIKFVKLKDIAKGATVLGTVILALLGISKIAGNKEFKAGFGALAGIAVDMLALTVSLYALQFVSWESIAKAIAAFIPILLGIGYCAKLASSSTKDGDAKLALAGMTATIVAMTLSLMALSTIPTKELLSAALAMDMFGAVIAVILKSLGSIKKIPKGSIGVLITLVSGIAGAIVALGFAVSLIKDDKGAASKIVAIGSMVTLMETSIIGTLWALSKFDLENLNAKILVPLIGVFTGMAALGAGLTFAASKFTGNTDAVYALGIMTSVLTLVMALAVKILQLPKAPGLKTGIGTFAVLGVVMAGVTGLLSLFSTFANADTYINLVYGAILTIGALTGLAYLLSKFGQEISKNWKWILLAGATIVLLGAEVLSGFMTLLAMIGGIYNSGWHSSILGALDFIQIVAEKIAETLGNMVRNLGGAYLDLAKKFIADTGSTLQEFVSSLSGISFDDILKGGLLAGLAVMIAVAGLITDFITIIEPIQFDTLSPKVQSFGKVLSDFSDSIQGVDSAAVKNSAEAILYLFAALALAPRSGGLIEWFISGNNDVDRVGAQLAGFGDSLHEYAKSLEGITNWPTVSSATTEIQKIFEALSKTPRSGGIIEWAISGNNDANNVGAQLAGFGDSLVDYANSLSNISNWSSVGTATTHIKGIFEALSQAPRSGGLIELLTGSNNVDDVGDQMSDLGKYLTKYASHLEEIDNWETVSSATGYIKDIFNALSQAPVQDVMDTITGVNDIDAAGSSLSFFGDAVVDFAESVSDISDWSTVTTGIEAMRSIFDVLDEFPEDLPGIFANSERGETEGARFSDGMHALGRGMRRYANTVDGVDFTEAFSATKIFCDIIQQTKYSVIDDPDHLIDVSESMVEVAENIREFFDTLGIDVNTNSIVSAVNDYVSIANTLNSTKTVNRVTFSDMLGGFDKVKASETVSGIRQVTSELKTLNSVVQLGGKITGGSGGKGTTNAMARVGLPTTIAVKKHVDEIGKTTEAGVQRSATKLAANAGPMFKPLYDEVVIDAGENGEDAGEAFGEGFGESATETAGGYFDKLAKKASEWGNSLLDKASTSNIPLIADSAKELKNTIGSLNIKEMTDWSNWASFDIFGGIEDKVNEAIEGIDDLGGAFDDIDGDDKSKKKKEKKLLSENEYWKKLLEIKQNGADASKYIDMDLADFQESILKDYTKMMDDFLDEYKSKNEEMSKNITGMSQVSMFRNKDGKIDYEFTDNEGHMDWKTIQQNLYDQELAARRYTNAMRLINDRVSNEALLKELNDLGIEDLEYLEVVANLSDKQLKEFETRSVNILTQGHEAAAQAMFTKSKELETEANKLLGTDLNIDQLTQMWNGMMSSLDDMVAADQGRFVEDGQHITEGIATGMVGEGARVAIGDAVSEVGTAIDDEGIREEMGIESPAKRMKPVGEFVTAGVAVGMDPTKDSMARLVVGVATRNISVTTYNMLMDAIRNRHFEKIGEYILEGVKRGLDNGSGAVMSAVSRIASKIDSTFRKPLRIESPSKVFEENGMYIDMGLANGINNHTGLVENATSNLANTALSSMQAAIALANDSLLNESGPSITPVWNSESIQNGINSMDSALMAQRSFLMANAAAANMDTSINKIITIDNHQAVDAITKLNNDMLALEERIGSLQVVLNSGILVGEMAPGMNNELGAIAMRGLREGAG